MLGKILCFLIPHCFYQIQVLDFDETNHFQEIELHQSDLDSFPRYEEFHYNQSKVDSLDEIVDYVKMEEDGRLAAINYYNVMYDALPMFTFEESLHFEEEKQIKPLFEGKFNKNIKIQCFVEDILFFLLDFNEYIIAYINSYIFCTIKDLLSIVDIIKLNFFISLLLNLQLNPHEDAFLYVYFICEFIEELLDIIEVYLIYNNN